MRRSFTQISVWDYVFIYLALIIFHIGSAESLEEKKPKCAYEDTVDISGSTKLLNGSYFFRGHAIPPDLVDYYDYDIIYENKRVPAHNHLRACICHMTSCIKFCCHPKATKVSRVRECTPESEQELNYYPYFNITDTAGETYERHVHNEMFIQQHLPCSLGYPLIEGSYKWQLMENGSLLLLDEEEVVVQLSKYEYCITVANSSEQYVLAPYICVPPIEPEPENLKVNCIAMLICLPFLVATIFIYAYFRELRNLHGKCLIAYLTSMAIGDVLLNTSTLMSIFNVNIPDTWCSIIGYLSYFFIMSAFFWLSIISFDLWYNFRGTVARVSRLLQQKRFYVYSLIGWFLPAVLTSLTIVAQLSSMSDNLKPGIGVAYCGIDVKKWSAAIYFYGPMMIIIFFNSTMFILTFLKIYRVQKELSRFSGKEEKNRHLRGERDDFFMFLRLFVVMGITWVFEILSFLIDSKVFYATDFLNSILGLIIFILFVMKRRVIMLIRKRLCRKDITPYESEDSSRSDCEPEDICMRNYNKDGTLQFLN